MSVFLWTLDLRNEYPSNYLLKLQSVGDSLMEICMYSLYSPLVLLAHILRLRSCWDCDPSPLAAELHCYRIRSSGLISNALMFR